MTRERRSLADPPADATELIGGPIFAPSDDYARCARSVFPTPWFFSTDGSGRFDLVDSPGHGTCYLANDQHGALREVLGPDYKVGTPVSRSFFRPRRIWLVSPAPTPWRTELVNLRSEHWDGSGLTAEVFSVEKYSTPQLWARRMFEAGYCGLVVALRHLLDPTRHGLALFGDEGAQPSDDRFPTLRVCTIDDDLLTEFANVTRIPIESPRAPASSLTIIS